MRLFRVTMSKISEKLNLLATFLLAVCTATAFFNVVMRYVFTKPFSWAEEACVLTMAWFVFASIPMLEQRNEHLTMTAVYSLLPGRVKRIINVFRSAVTILIGAGLTYGGYVVVLRNFNLKVSTQTLNVPYWIVYLIIPAAFFVIIFVRLADMMVSKTALVDAAAGDPSAAVEKPGCGGDAG